MNRAVPPGHSPLSLGTIVGGRPLVHDGRLIVADTATSDLWTDDVSPEVNPLDDVTRRALAAQWLDDGLAEHASIAAFTRVATQLLAVGAPPEMLEDAHRAALDEVRHARLCFTLAGMYGGAWKAPGAIDVGAIRDARCDLASIAREALVEGCLGEGTAASLAATASKRCDDPEVKRCLAAIADDEARHEALAWRILTWCLDRGGDDVGDAVAQALRAMPATVPLFDLPPGVDRRQWSACGRALPEEAAATHATVAASVSSRAWQHPKMASRVSAVSPRRAQPRSRR
jgi:hypothetical protein